MVGLGYLPGTSHSNAIEVSADGSVIVGYSQFRNDKEAFRWTAEEEMVGLGHLTGSTVSYAADCSADGSIIVGWCEYEADFKPFLWTEDDGMQDLQVMLSGLGIDLSGWTLDFATGISADGTVIVGYGTNPNGYTEAWMATIPEPTSLAMLALGGLGILRSSRRFGA